MIYYDRIDVSEENDINKTSASKGCDIYHHWYFLGRKFTCKLNVYNGCHDVLMMAININDIAILNIQCVDYRCIINGIIESGALNLLQNADSTKESGVLEK